MGDSRGRWEGNTLVVETTNYKGGHAPMINLAVVGSPPANRFPHSDQMKTTERITRLNDDMWLYEIKTEDPVILTALVHRALPDAPRSELRVVGVRVPRGQHDRAELHEHVAARARESGAFAGTAGCHGGRQEPADQGARPCRHRESAGWTLGRRPELKTMDYDIIIEFTARPDGGIVGKLVETTLPDPREVPINKSLHTTGADGSERGFTINGRRLTFTFPNTQPWNFAGELSADGTSIEV